MTSASEHAWLVGATIGNYRVVAKLGEGGMGAVYLAEHPLIGKKVALKVLHQEYSSNQDIVARFFHEAKAIHDIGHPNIVDFIDYGVLQAPTGAGFAYFIMEFLAGESLAALLQREGAMPPERAFHIGMQVADALASAHHKGIVHRDLKPDNIFVLQRARDRDFAKLLDFGIAKLTGERGGSSQRTRTGIVMGTPAYMSPEQCEGRGQVDHRADVYQLGIVLYEMIAGRVPFAGEGYGAVLVQHLTCEPAWPSMLRPGLPPSAEAVVMKALRKNPAERYQWMEEFIAAMANPDAYIAQNGGVDAFGRPAVQSIGPTMAMPPTSAVLSKPNPTTLTQGAGQVSSRPDRRRWPLMVVSGVVGLAVAAGVAVAIIGNNQGAPEAPQATSPPQEKPPPPPAEEVKPVEVKPPEPKVEVKPVEPEPKVDPAPPPPPAEIHVRLASVPAGAEAVVDGKSVGKTPLDIQLPRGDGESEVVLKLRGYAKKTRKISVAEDGEYTIALEEERVRRPPVETKKPPPEPKPPEPPKQKPKQKPPGDDDDLLPPSSY